MKALLSFVLIALATTALASFPRLSWEIDWVPSVNDSYCMLSRRYQGSRTFRPDQPNLTSEPVFDSFVLRFSYHKFSDVEHISDSEFGELNLTLHAGPDPKQAPMQHRIYSVRIKSFRFELRQFEGSQDYVFLLNGDEARNIYESLINGESLEVVLGLSGDQTVRLDIPNRLKGRFRIWAAMLEACVATNVT